MSRSRKKHPIYKWKDRYEKRRARRVFRHYKGDVPITARQFHRKISDSWSVWDNWYYDFNNKKSHKRYKEIVKELEQNEFDTHLTEEEAYELLEELKELLYYNYWLLYVRK